MIQAQAFIRSAAETHRGLVRTINEDALLCRPEIGLWAIADGMGGHSAGDYAAQTVIGALNALSPHLCPSELMHGARDCIQTAHATIRAEAERQGRVTIGTTAVLLLIAEGHFLCLWAGDSRLYRLRDGALRMLTTDHSVVGELVEAGQITWEQAEHHPHANQITRAVGVGADLEIDKRRGEVAPGDKFLLCSDGLTKYAAAAELEMALGKNPPEAAVESLLQIALNGGGADNISIIVVEA